MDMSPDRRHLDCLPRVIAHKSTNTLSPVLKQNSEGLVCKRAQSFQTDAFLYAAQEPDPFYLFSLLSDRNVSL